MRNQKGITLIALVITIIVLIILAAVSIAMLTGDSGILTEADSARDMTNESTIADKINMELNAFKTDILADEKISYESYSQALKSLGEGYTIKAGTTAEETTEISSSTVTDQEKLDTALTDATVVVISNGEISGSINIDNGKVTKATENATTLRHPVNGNSIITKSKATSYDSALSLARGLTAPILHFDEPEFTNHIKTIVSNSVSTFNTAAQRAKENGAMYGRIFTCTNPGCAG